MAELICKWVPSIEKVRMVNSGTEATMSCIRLARGFTGRDKIVKFEGCYHGHVDSLLVSAGSGALTHGRPDSAGVPQAFADLTIALPFNDISAVRTAFHANDDIAAVILEPVPANAGLYFPAKGFLESLRNECSKHGALLIFDEVMTGFRVARGGAQEIFGARPDLTALGKVIGGGLPVGAFGGRAEIMDHLSPDGPVYQAGTLSGNPLAMAAGLAQLRELDRIDGWALLEKLGAQFEEATRATLHDLQRPFTFHRIGSMFCLFFTPGPVLNLADAKRSDLKLFAKFFNSCLDRGVYFAPSQFETGFLSTAHSPADVTQTAEVEELQRQLDAERETWHETRDETKRRLAERSQALDETAADVSLEAMRIFGGYGYTKEFRVERYYRDAPLMLIGEGTNEIQRLVIARGLLARADAAGK
jgi:glutamate-1-semialdehyde 2,1-aminomutase